MDHRERDWHLLIRDQYASMRCIIILNAVIEWMIAITIMIRIESRDVFWVNIYRLNLIKIYFMQHGAVYLIKVNKLFKLVSSWQLVQISTTVLPNEVM